MVCLNDKSQMLKGTLEGCILQVIKSHETYGYEISEKLKENGFPNISEGTIYPLLLRLEKNELIKGTLKNSPVGPKRKYYSLTEKGDLEIENFFINWKILEKAVHSLFSHREMQE